MSAGKLVRWIGGAFAAFIGIGLVGSMATPSTQIVSTTATPRVTSAALGDQSTPTPTVSLTPSPNPTATPAPTVTLKSVVTPIRPRPATTNSLASTNCDPNYSGACVPNVYPSDVDCAGGSGNGPYYVAGPARLIGVDRYKLDRDGEGIACE